MSKHLRHEMGYLQKRMLELSAKVEENVLCALKAVENRDEAMAQGIIESDDEIDRLEVEIEEECMKALALYQPVAIDLRVIVSILKINNDLERVGDLAVTIARRAFALVEIPGDDVAATLRNMAETSWRMFRKSLDAFVEMQEESAVEVVAEDKQVDAMNKQIYNFVKQEIRAHPDRLDSYLQLLRISRSLERIGDHACNVAEDVLYMLEGDIVRHKPISENGST